MLFSSKQGPISVSMGDPGQPPQQRGTCTRGDHSPKQGRVVIPRRASAWGTQGSLFIPCTQSASTKEVWSHYFHLPCVTVIFLYLEFKGILRKHNVGIPTDFLRCHRISGSLSLTLDGRLAQPTRESLPAAATP